MKHYSLYLLLVCVFLLSSSEGLGARKRKARRYYPPVTHPVILWARTLSTSSDPAEQKVAAFKLSAYTQQIFQGEAIQSLLSCIKDSAMEIRVLCTKALGRAGTQSHTVEIRKALVTLYKDNPPLRSTIVRTFITRKDNSPEIHSLFLEETKATTDPESLVTLLIYLEQFGDGSSHFVERLTELYKQTSEIRTRRAIVRALSERAQGQNGVIELLTECTDSKDTPLVLNCLSGLQSQARQDARVWKAIQKTIDTADSDVLIATLDVINALEETTDPQLSLRLVALLEDSNDPEIIEKLALALGVCGDKSSAIVSSLIKIIESKDSEESVKIAAALTLGKQSVGVIDNAKTILTQCLSQGTQPLRTACQLGIKELEARNIASRAPLPNSPKPKE